METKQQLISPVVTYIEDLQRVNREVYNFFDEGSAAEWNEMLGDIFYEWIINTHRKTTKEYGASVSWRMTRLQYFINRFEWAHDIVDRPNENVLSSGIDMYNLQHENQRLKSELEQEQAVKQHLQRLLDSRECTCDTLRKHIDVLKESLALYREPQGEEQPVSATASN
ncbi:hypothetical protein ACFSUS_22590 [Spirosoma soli]|uniref:Uncharacterized protein n=1 Tax=Spirosoma soli TaxID=1770529 RepID=A0ABW5MAK8_9BACT